jgi:hypothetical protein
VFRLSILDPGSECSAVPYLCKSQIRFECAVSIALVVRMLFIPYPAYLTLYPWRTLIRAFLAREPHDTSSEFKTFDTGHHGLLRELEQCQSEPGLNASVAP